MTSKQRVRKAIRHENPDRVPAAFEAVGSVVSKLLRHYDMQSIDQVREKFEIDIVPVSPAYIGPELKSYRNEKGELVQTSYWGFEKTMHATAVDVYGMTSYYPMNHVESLTDLENLTFPDPDWFDYAGVAEQCEKYPDKALIVGHEGPFQMVTNLMEMDRFFMLMVDEPQAAKGLLNRMVEFELEYYRRIFEAGGGKIDILRPHDDYGTQISLLFSPEMWREFFRDNTRRLVELAHRYGAFYQQHSCGAVAPLIPELIDCGVDVLEPLQKLPGLLPKDLLKYKGQIAFYGGIDTQQLLPTGTPQAVAEETRRYIDALGNGGGYILMASQGIEGDVPVENIEALYSGDRTPS